LIHKGGKHESLASPLGNVELAHCVVGYYSQPIGVAVRLSCRHHLYEFSSQKPIEMKGQKTNCKGKIILASGDKKHSIRSIDKFNVLS
jgi:hypothetical protein